ncbi:Hypothetical protein SMAX5B_003097 [Scophthalmus maximus]|uniref:Uncharacterized protein n=1 Tax=Scophthalmus maximus TaxID=52904 RepID=A0A2U9BMC1_SCOMX|nr:Hypothetical protein SMAX5B_003097 [Scophthalmus maximus]
MCFSVLKSLHPTSSPQLLQPRLSYGPSASTAPTLLRRSYDAPTKPLQHLKAPTLLRCSYDAPTAPVLLRRSHDAPTMLLRRSYGPSAPTTLL